MLERKGIKIDRKDKECNKRGLVVAMCNTRGIFVRIVDVFQVFVYSMSDASWYRQNNSDKGELMNSLNVRQTETGQSQVQADQTVCDAC